MGVVPHVTLYMGGDRNILNETRRIKVNPSCPTDTIWRRKSGPTLAQEMACCLTGSRQYLNQCRLITSAVLFYSRDNDNFTGNAQDICPWYAFQNYYFKSYSKSGQNGTWGQNWTPGVLEKKSQAWVYFQVHLISVIGQFSVLHGNQTCKRPRFSYFTKTKFTLLINQFTHFLTSSVLTN